MNDDDDEAMPPPKPTVTIGSPTSSEKEAAKPPPLARIITTASVSSPPKNCSKKQKTDKKEKETLVEVLHEDEDDYILENNRGVKTLTNFAYPEMITEQCFHKLSKRGGCSESIAKITEIMQLEKDFRKKYHGNRIMYKNWFWLHEDEKTDLVPIY